MKLSNYNAYIPYNDKFILYNTLYKKILFIDNALNSIIENNKNKIETIENIYLSFYNILVKNNFIIDSDKDEIIDVLKIIESIDYRDDEFNLIINPTMNCNFRCWYCYEDHISESKMSNETIKLVKLFIKNTIENKKINKFILNFFGGEPLLCFDDIVLPIIKYTYKLANKNNKKLVIQITTNGYLLNENRIKILAKYKVTNFQITVDGSKEYHNSVRVPNLGINTYDTIIDNIQMVVANNMSVTLRVNYTEKNLHSIKNIIDDFKFLTKREKSRIMLSMQRVWQNQTINSVLSKYKQDSIEIGLKQTEDLINDYAEKNGIQVTPKIAADQFLFSCYADKKNEAVINYDSNVFKCTARNFTPQSREGLLSKTGEIKWNEKYYDRMGSKIKNKPCKSCNIFPICGGGCRQMSVEYKDKDYCMLYFDEDSKNGKIISLLNNSNFLQQKSI